MSEGSLDPFALLDQIRRLEAPAPDILKAVGLICPLLVARSKGLAQSEYEALFRACIEAVTRMTGCAEDVDNAEIALDAMERLGLSPPGFVFDWAACSVGRWF